MTLDELKAVLNKVEDNRKSIPHHAVCGTDFFAILRESLPQAPDESSPIWGIPITVNSAFRPNTLRIFNADDECLKEMHILVTD